MRAVLVLALACAACRASGTFACATSDQCQGGTCEPTGYCGFADTSCPSGFRYDPYAGGGLAGECVTDGTGDGGTDDGSSSHDVLHLGSADSASGTAALMLGGTITIDTSALTISGVTLPSGDTFDARPQLGGGPELAVLHVGSLDVASGANVRVIGSRPLVIVSAGLVEIAGTLDAGAHGMTPGAGGKLGMAAGSGMPGGHGSNDSDSGGGGGGYGTAGASGGAISNGCTVAAGIPGGAYGDAAITQLVGGSGGGPSSGTACPVDPGGAGGGALQITSAAMIDISASGAVLAGGGGGSGGSDCAQSDVNSGAGGGSGGAIVLQAPAISSAGVIAANGGGGGGSSSTGNGSAPPGQDGQPGTTPATGGTGPVASGGVGGAGGAAPGPGGGASCGTNAGGGGGSVGRIAASTGYTGAGTTSPAVSATLPL